MEADFRSPTWLRSAYPIVPLPPLTAATMPEVWLAPSPDLIGHTLSAGNFHAPSPAFSRYSVKFFVVPDSSERCTGAIAVLGSLASGLSALMAASSHFLMVPAKIPESTLGDSWSLSTPSRL